MHKAFPLPVMEFLLPEEVPTASEESSHCQKKREATFVKDFTATKVKKKLSCSKEHQVVSELEMDQQNPTLAKIPILDTGKFEQWQFRIQQYLQHEHYALWEVIEFGDSYEVPVSTASTTTTDAASDATGKKKGRTITLTAEDMQKRKNNVKARTTLLLSLPDEHQLRFTEGLETLEQTFNRLQVIIGQLQFMDVEIEQGDLNQKFLTSLAPELLMHTIVWRNRSDLDTMSLDDLYNHLKSYMANDEENHALVANKEALIEFALMANTSAESKVFDNSLCSKDCKKNSDSLNILKKKLETLKKEKEELNGKLVGFQTAFKDLDILLESQRLDKNKEGLGYKSSPEDAQNRNPSVTETEASPTAISPKSFIKFLKANDNPTKSKIEKAEKAKKSPVKYAQQYKNQHRNLMSEEIKGIGTI
nr:hypothetical protein [Tanacetum cinerariifolium]